jgi:hypothetical protein
MMLPRVFKNPNKVLANVADWPASANSAQILEASRGETTLFYQELKICKFEHSIETILLCASSIGCPIDNATYQICAIFNVQGFHLIVLSH